MSSADPAEPGAASPAAGAARRFLAFFARVFLLLDGPTSDVLVPLAMAGSAAEPDGKAWLPGVDGVGMDGGKEGCGSADCVAASSASPSSTCMRSLLSQHRERHHDGA